MTHIFFFFTLFARFCAHTKGWSSFFFLWSPGCCIVGSKCCVTLFWTESTHSPFYAFKYRIKQQSIHWSTEELKLHRMEKKNYMYTCKKINKLFIGKIGRGNQLPFKYDENSTKLHTTRHIKFKFNHLPSAIVCEKRWLRIYTKINVIIVIQFFIVNMSNKQHFYMDVGQSVRCTMLTKKKIMLGLNSFRILTCRS